jgi:hypothetical protein
LLVFVNILYGGVDLRRPLLGIERQMHPAHRESAVGSVQIRLSASPIHPGQIHCPHKRRRRSLHPRERPRLGNDHRDHKQWRCDLRLYPDERTGYFRWGDEPPGHDDQPGRVFEVDNLITAERPAPPNDHVGMFGPGGESAAHRMLKLYVASHPLEFGLSAAAVPHVEYSFATGDRVDVMFENHLPDRTVVEVEVEGELQVCIGVHQAMKYRSLAAADAGFPLLTSRVRSVVVAYSVEYPKARELAERYDIPLLAADRETVLAGAR